MTPVGAGEPATVVIAPVIANAIANATGVRLRQVPFTPRAVDGSRWRLGTEWLQPGEIRWAPEVRYGQRYQGRPRNLWINVALCWRLSHHMQRRHTRQQADEPWYLATNQPSAQQSVAWYRQRCWIEESFKDSKSRFYLKQVRIGSPERLTRLLLALTIALCWLALAALPEEWRAPARVACRRCSVGPRQLPQPRPCAARRLPRPPAALVNCQSMS